MIPANILTFKLAQAFPNLLHPGVHKKIRIPSEIDSRAWMDFPGNTAVKCRRRVISLLLSNGNVRSTSQPTLLRICTLVGDPICQCSSSLQNAASVPVANFIMAGLDRINFRELISSRS